MFHSIMCVQKFDSHDDTQDLIKCGAIYWESSLAISIPWGDDQSDSSRNHDTYDQYVLVGLGSSVSLKQS
jgi:hypothetical protein